MIRAGSLNSSVSPRMLYVHITGHITSLVSPRKSHNRPLPGQRHREHKCHVSCCTDAELPGSLWHLYGSKPGGISRTVFQIPANSGDFPWSLPNLIHIHQHRANHTGVTPILNAAPLLGQRQRRWQRSGAALSRRQLWFGRHYIFTQTRPLSI